MSESHSTELPQMLHQDLTELFQALGSAQSPTAIHGSLAGVLAAGHRLSKTDWLEWVVDQLGPVDPLTENQQVMLLAFYVSTVKALEDSGLSFKPLLPEDDSPMTLRLEALSDWCGCFIGAFGTVGVLAEGKEIPQEVEEILEDLSAIAQIDTESDDSAEAEEDYIAVSEHVRMAALSLYLEYNKTNTPDTPKQTLH
ncbi:MAG: UPF0149 family protein [Saccharospirillum sp.]|nr:UPF0149 family protein [Saccharospirillum sp.]